MICSKCNHALPDDSEFCQYCGNRIEQQIPTQENLVEEKFDKIIDLNKASESPENNLLKSEHEIPEEMIPVVIEGQEGTIKSLQERKKTRTRFCKFCGCQINPQTKKCGGCGKQYFKGIKFPKNLFFVVICLMLLVSLILNIIQYREIKYVSERKEYWSTRTKEMIYEFNTYKSYGKSDPNAVQRLRDKVATDNAINESKLRITDKEKATIINYNNPKIENIVFSKQPNIFYFVERSVIGRSAYKITFNTTQDDLLGPIVYYVEKSSGQLIGMDFRE